MKRLLAPKVLIPTVLSVAIIVALLGFGDIHKVLRLMVSFPRIYLLWYLLLMVAYEAVRCLQWHLLLGALSVRIPLRTQIFAFLTGEIAKTVPVGNYFQNYLIQRSNGADFGLTSAATTFVVLIETAVCLVGVVIIGVGVWSGWLRPLIVIGLLVTALIVWIVASLHKAGRAPQWMQRRKAWRTVLQELRNFWTGAKQILHPRVLILASLLGALYLMIAGSALYLVTRGLGINLSIWGAWAVYFFSLAFSLIFPLPVDIGVLEVSGVGAFLAQGVGKPPAVGAMLINRVLSFGSSVAIALVGAAVLRDEARQAFRDRPRKPPKDQARPERESPDTDADQDAATTHGWTARI
ncbi:MAG TPA: lysylphosphatidylglycerol synthase transmembrane domain-containing protein [Ktedonobacterales bacterium]|nr:lysylphosphatidylglycerol synthase transmembrane domain-containing protein [Ktedonobacterales bacterium]